MDRRAAPKAQDQIQDSEKAALTANSLPDRIGASARALFQSAVLRPSSGATLDTLASISSVAEKGDSSSSHAGSISSTEASSSRPSSTSSSQARTPFGALNDNLRTDTKHGTVHDIFDLDAFLAGGTEPLIDHANEPTNARGFHQLEANEYMGSEQQSPLPVPRHKRIVGDYTTNCGQSQTAFESTGALRRECAGSPAWTNGSQDSFDGAEVVALLSDPNFCVDQVPLDCDSSAQVRSLHQSPNLRRPEEVVHPDIIDNGLRLIPNLGSAPAAFEKMAASMPHMDECSQDIDLQPYKLQSSDLQSFDLQPWLDILSSYHEEVWGDMLPLVQEPRGELNPKKTGVQDLIERPALRRLQMLLGHLDH